MSAINRHKTGLALGSFIGLCHLTWSLLVAFGLAQGVIHWIFRLHFIQPPFTVTAFRFGIALTVIVVKFTLGYILGWMLAAILNYLHQTE